jgi:probable DNA repair protein
MTIAFDFTRIAETVDQDTLILTPNARTQKAVYAGQISSIKDEQVIQSLDVKSLSQWQGELWSELSFLKVLPKRVSSLTLKSWLEKVINQEDAWTLTNSSGVAAKALEAYQNLVHWNLSLSDVVPDETTEIDYFLSWTEQLHELCTKQNITPEFASLYMILENMDIIEAMLPRQILMVGFNQLTPLQQRLIDILKTHQVEISHYELDVRPLNCVQHNFNSLQEELDFAAHYAQTFLDQDLSVGIVVENLAGNLNQVHRSFSRVFQPLEHKPWIKIDKPKYNVSAGYSLNEQPIVKAAVKILALKPHKITIEDLHFLKNSSHINWGDDAVYIRKFIYQLCLSPRKYFTTIALLKQIEQSDHKGRLSELKFRLEKMQEQVMTTESLSKHIKNWRAKLSIWHWGKDDSNTSFESQAKAMFNTCIGDCSALSDVYQKIAEKAAFDYLKQLIQMTSFQIASDRTNIHVLGILEASGLQFDHLIIVGFNSNNWPQKNKINPFLPLALQREHNMPGNSAEREFEYAKQLSNALIKGANQLIVTVSSSESEAVVVAPFFNQFRLAPCHDYADEQLVKEIEPDYRWINDNHIAIDNGSVRGGAYLLSDYAKCPFKSMANFQLKLEAYQSPEVGIEPRVKGTWLHDTMEIIWTKLKQQRQLLSLDNKELADLVEQSLSKAMEKHHGYLLAVTEADIIALEYNKLASLIIEWLTVEKQRDNFSIAFLEEPIELNLEPIRLNFRVDRVDKNDSGLLEIIDYKSGKTDIKQWFGVRPSEAQMPAYVVALKEQRIDSLSYARIRTGEVAQSGIRFSKSEPQISRLERKLDEYQFIPIKNLDSVSFKGLVEQWEKTLGRIAIGISDGYMAVSPKEKSTTCTYCDYQSVCRINESQPETFQLLEHSQHPGHSINVSDKPKEQAE